MKKAEGNGLLVRRLKPEADLRLELEGLAAEIDAGTILCLVGSLSCVRLRPAGESEALEIKEALEIVSATGTLGSGGIHVHLAVSDKRGTTYGGHLLKGSLVRTTVELVVADYSSHWRFDRALDSQTGYPELLALSKD